MLRQFFCLPENHSLARRHDLDWLRVLAFGLLIFYHIGMFYVANWDFHIKSEHRSVALESLMLAVNRWRMPLLWFVAGVAMRIVLNKISPTRFVTQRSLRLLLPLLFGVLVIVPPQLYCEMSYRGDLPAMSYWQFYRAFFDLSNPLFAKYQPGIWPHIDVNHLWFVRELWTFSLLLLLLTPLLRWLALQRWLAVAFERHFHATIALLTVPTVLITIFGDDRLLHGFYFLFIGYLIGNMETFWSRTTMTRRLWFGIAVACYLAIVPLYNFIWLDESLRAKPLWQISLMSLATVFTWVSLLAIFGYAKQYLNRPSKTLSYFSDAVLPFYIVHQTVIVVAAFNLSKVALPVAVEASLLITITVAVCFASYELFRRVSLLRLLFGMHVERAGYSPIMQRLAYLVLTVTLFPFALELLI